MKTYTKNIFYLLCILCVNSSAHITRAAFFNNQNNSQSKPMVENKGSEVDFDDSELDFNKFQSLVNQMWPHAVKSKGKELNMFVGPTGEGKSTTISFLLGCRMKKTRYKIPGGSDNPFAINYRTVIDVDKDATGGKFAAIGHTMESCTLWPSCLRDPIYYLTLCDCPGFFDNRGIEEQCCIALGTKAIVNHSNGVKSIIFVISKPSLLGSRAKVFSEVLQTLQKMFENPEDHTASIFFAFTKGEGWDKNQFGAKVFEYTRHLKDQLDKDKHNPITQKKAKNNDEDNKNPTDIKLMYHFLDKMVNKHTDHFFVVYPTKPETRTDILEKFQKTPLIDKRKIRFMGGKEVHRNATNFYYKTAYSANKNFYMMEVYPEKIITYKKEKQKLELEIKQGQQDYENAKKSHEKKVREAMKQKNELAMKRSEVKIASLCESMLEQKVKLGQIEGKRNNHETRDIIKKAEYTYGANKMVKRSNKVLDGYMKEVSGTKKVKSGTKQVVAGHRQEHYQESVPYWRSGSTFKKGKTKYRMENRTRNVPIYKTVDVFEEVPTYKNVERYKTEYYYSCEISVTLGMPFVNVHDIYTRGTLSNIKSNPSKGEYSATYICDDKSKAKLTLAFFVEKKLEYQSEILRWNKDIQSLSTKIEDYKKKVEAEKEEIYKREEQNIELMCGTFDTKSVNAILSSIQSLTNNKKEALKQVEASIEKAEIDLKKARQEIVKKMPILNLLLSTYTLLGFKKSQPGCIPLFVKSYEKFLQKNNVDISNVNNYDDEKKNDE